MPYSKPSDAPDYVPENKKAQWVAVWNDVYKNAIKDGMSKEDAEKKAFAQATAVINKRSTDMSKTERRYINLTLAEFRAEQDGDKTFISGYAARFNQASDPAKLGYAEVIKPGAFSRALKEKQDVRALINHEPSKILGRSTANTLSLSEDENGLKWRCEMPNTSYARDLMESIKRGDVSQCSFGFRAQKQAWVEPTAKDGVMTRELHDVDLFDVSAVTFPVYDGTSVGQSRALEMRSLFPDGVPEDVTEHVPELRAEPKVDLGTVTVKIETEVKTEERTPETLSEADRLSMAMRLDLAKRT